MKLAVAAAALLALATSSTFATAEQEMWIAIFGYSNKDKFVSKLVEMLQNPESTFPDEDAETEDQKAVAEWAEKCIQGDMSIAVPEMDMDFEQFDEDIIKELDFSEQDLVKLTMAFSDIENPDNTALLKKFYGKIVGLFKFETKFYWVTDSETMKQDICKSSAVLSKALSSQPLFKDIFKVIKYEKVNMTAEQFNSCVVKETNSEGEEVITAPVCGEKASSTETKACVACSISNSVVASTMIAGAMIAASLFF